MQILKLWTLLQTMNVIRESIPPTMTTIILKLPIHFSVSSEMPAAAEYTETFTPITSLTITM